MKLFLVMSDSHGNVGNLEKIIDQYPYINSIIHLGDYYRDAARLRELHPDKEYFMVPGNCDISVSGVPSEMMLDVEGLKVLVTHGNKYGVKNGIGRLQYRAVNDGIDVVLFGHTHVPLVRREEKLLLVNPGSADCPRGGSMHPTYALLEIGNGRAEARIMEVV